MITYKKIPHKFVEIEHTADMGIHARGDTLAEAFANSAFGMLHLINNTSAVSEIREEKFSLTRSSLSDLVVSWLSEINYLLLVHRFFMTAIQDLKIVESDGEFYLNTVLLGGDPDIESQDNFTEIKAVTYHQLQCEKKDNGYAIRVFFDI